MKIRILGTRGSVPTTNPETFQYGGNTACIELIQGDQLLIVDAGTGILNLSTEQIKTRSRFNILLTHLHFDHIQGLGFFKPMFNPASEIHIYGPASNLRSLQYRLNRYLSPPLFPVHYRDLPCKIELHEISHSQFEISGLHIESNYVSHPGPTVGYRISNGKSIFTYLPDHEPVIEGKNWNRGLEWISGMHLAWHADLLIHDSQYTTEEYQTKTGWGHCTMDDAIKFASLAEVKKLLLFHHDPHHTDSYLESMYHEINHENSTGFKINLAREGEIIELK